MNATDLSIIKEAMDSIEIAPPETVPYETFEIEKNAKNKAYAFILSHGYFDDFVVFSKSYQGNAHDDCINTLKKRLDNAVEALVYLHTNNQLKEI